MRYGFAIDQRTCIGCHACTVACKTEHEIPVGQFRTWVKYVDKGEYPANGRAFGVMRCNHCTDAPCVAICPTKALFKRDDGIVDFDSERCIGCKSCQQGCPYDAIYIDEDTHTAAKCNFCAHRVDQGLAPACVVVCPTQSIWVGDLDDESSGISRLVAAQPTSVRSPEQRTEPNVFYIGADEVVLDPLAAPVDDSYIWAHPDPLRLEQARDGYGSNPTARTTLNTAHPRPWGWRVVTYLWTKGVGAGALLVAGLAFVFAVPLGAVGQVVAPAVAVGFTAATGVLLVWDLKRPERFLYIFVKANPRSWLVWGSAALVVYSALAGAWLLVGALSAAGAVHAAGLLGVFAWLGIPLAALAAGYTAFLFGQAEGRDLWQSPLLVWDLLAQAALAGSAGLLLLGPLAGLTEAGRRFFVQVVVVSAVAHLLLLAVEYTGGHRTRAAAVAARIATRGRYRRTFWGFGVTPTAFAAALVGSGWGGGAGPAVLLGALAAQVGILGYESVFVRAGQDVPLS
jgi:Fe-S-cluster-containing dehydrogenase component/formate-dependent nitrite reductase membrane component NrfD